MPKPLLEASAPVPEINLNEEFSGQLEFLKEWFGSALVKLQAENLELQREIAELRTASAEKVPVSTGVVLSLDADACRPLCERPAAPANGSNGCQDHATAAQPATVAIEIETSRTKGKKRSCYHLGLYPALREIWQEPELGEDSQALGSLTEPALDKKAMRQRINEEINRAMRKKNGEDSLVQSCRIALPLHPHSATRMCWDCLAALALLFDCITIPMGAFTFESTELTVVSRAVLVYWTLDMFVQCITAFYDRRGRLVTSFRQICWKYAQTWFVPDMLVVVTEWVTIVASAKTEIWRYRALAKSIRALRLMRMLRILRLVKLKEFIMRVEEFIASEYISTIWGVVCNLMILLMMTHVIGCVWFFLGTRSEYGWVKFYEVDNQTLTAQYFISLHWSLTQFTPASMMVQPRTSDERIFVVGVVCVAMVTFSQFVSSITASMNKLRSLEQESTTNHFQLRKFLKNYQISPGLSARIIRYIDIAMAAHKKLLPRASVKLLSYLSGPLNVELLMEMYMPHLQAHPYFYRHLSSNVIGHMCCRAIELLSTSQRDVIFHRLRQATHFLLLQSGTMAYKVRNEDRTRRIVRVPSGSWVCEAVLWVDWFHQGMMQALTECQLLSVDSKKFSEVVASHITSVIDTRAYAKEFLHELQESIDQNGRAWDVSDPIMYASETANPTMRRSNTSMNFEPVMKKSEIAEAETFDVHLLLDRDDSDVDDASSIMG